MHQPHTARFHTDTTRGIPLDEVIRRTDVVTSLLSFKPTLDGRTLTSAHDASDQQAALPMAA